LYVATQCSPPHVTLGSPWLHNVIYSDLGRLTIGSYRRTTFTSQCRSKRNQDHSALHIVLTLQLADRANSSLLLLIVAADGSMISESMPLPSFAQALPPTIAPDNISKTPLSCSSANTLSRERSHGDVNSLQVIDQFAPADRLP
jgi:hypothetical protein